MVDFSLLQTKSVAKEASDPVKIFESLPKSGGINNLYHIQAKILQEWFTKLRNDPNVVVELNTGGGKTLVGLLMALSTMREFKEGVIYLVANNQLADQVVSQAKSVGIPAKKYLNRDSVDADFANGKTILVASYQALFNGQSVFGVKGVKRDRDPIGGIVIDDAHASLEAIRDAFTFTIPAENSNGLYLEILALFHEAFRAIDCEQKYEEFYSGIGNGVVEIPFSYWQKKKPQFFKKIAGCFDAQGGIKDNIGDELKSALAFNWPLVKDNLKYCQVIVSRTAITISALYPLLDMIPSFSEARRRIYMSATITDYSDMVRIYDLRSLTEDKIIVSKTSSGVARRMVLSLSQEILDNEKFRAIIKEELNQGHGVVRLTPRIGGDVNWGDIEFATPVGHDEVSEAIDRLLSGSSTEAVSLANRYNGVDLPGDACRILVLENLPQAMSDIDTLTEQYLSKSKLTNQRIAQRIEQGAGRGARGASDHCVVLLLGHQLIEWVKRKNRQKYFSEAFRAQLQIGEEIREEIKDAKDYCEVMKKDLCSDDDWRRFHAARLAEVIFDEDARRLDDSLDVAYAEREAFVQWRRERQNGKACQILEAKANALTDDDQYRGWLFYLASRIAYEGGDGNRAEKLLQDARKYNKSLPRFELSPTSETEIEESVFKQAEAICEQIKSVCPSSELLAQFARDTENLTFDVSFSDFEESLQKLGAYLGFESRQEDNEGEGSDVYWILQGDIAFVLEAKNEKKPKNPLYKKEAGQLRNGCDWLKNRHPNPDFEIVPVSVHPNAIAKSEASAENLFVLTPEKLEELKGSVRLLLEAAVKVPPDRRLGQLLHGLSNGGPTAQRIKEDYLQPFITNQK